MNEDNLWAGGRHERTKMERTKEEAPTQKPAEEEQHMRVPRGSRLTDHVLLSLKMGALCRADTTDTRAWRLFSSSSFCTGTETVALLLPSVSGSTLRLLLLRELTFAIFTKWLRISARVFSFWAVKISRTSQKLTCRSTWRRHSKTPVSILQPKSLILLQKCPQRDQISTEATKG